MSVATTRTTTTTKKPMQEERGREHNTHTHRDELSLSATKVSWDSSLPGRHHSQLGTHFCGPFAACVPPRRTPHRCPWRPPQGLPSSLPSFYTHTHTHTHTHAYMHLHIPAVLLLLLLLLFSTAVPVDCVGVVLFSFGALCLSCMQFIMCVCLCAAFCGCMWTMHGCLVWWWMAFSFPLRSMLLQFLSLGWCMGLSVWLDLSPSVCVCVCVCVCLCLAASWMLPPPFRGTPLSLRIPSRAAVSGPICTIFFVQRMVSTCDCVHACGEIGQRICTHMFPSSLTSRMIRVRVPPQCIAACGQVEL